VHASSGGSSAVAVAILLALKEIHAKANEAHVCLALDGIATSTIVIAAEIDLSQVVGMVAIAMENRLSVIASYNEALTK
jgi:hypothetical protein